MNGPLQRRRGSAAIARYRRGPSVMRVGYDVRAGRALPRTLEQPLQLLVSVVRPAVRLWACMDQATR